jgi:hypothetical protein
VAMMDAVGQSPELNPRMARIDLAAADLKQIAKLKPGTPVRVVLRGKLTEQTQMQGMGDDQKNHGSICLEVAKVAVAEVGGAAIDELIDEED